MKAQNQIKNFLKQKNCFPIFARPYSLGMLLAVYQAYYKYLKYESGCKVNNVLVHKRLDGQFEFYVDFGNITPCLLELVNEKNDTNRIIQSAEKYYKRIKKFDELKKDGSAQKLFWLATKILAFEAHSFIIPYIENDMKLPFKYKNVVKVCTSARLKTEKLFQPKGIMDETLRTNSYIPKTMSGFSKTQKEYLIFNNKFINDKLVISGFKQSTKIEKREQTISGNIACKGKAMGRVKIILSSLDFKKMKKNDILVASGTTPDYLPVIKLASAIVADEGGILSHAAIISREFQIPCVIGTKNATKSLKDGDLVEVDANNGKIIIKELANNQ